MPDVREAYSPFTYSFAVESVVFSCTATELRSPLENISGLSTLHNIALQCRTKVSQYASSLLGRTWTLLHKLERYQDACDFL